MELFIAAEQPSAIAAAFAHMRPSLFIFIAAVVLAGLFLLFKFQLSQYPEAASTPHVTFPARPALPLETPPAQEGHARSPPMPLSQTSSPERDTQAAGGGNPSRHEFEVRVAHGKLESGPRVIKLLQGETVTLRVTSDEEDEIHVHGYDLHKHLQANKPATLTFVAALSGRFTYELHHAELELGALEVYPR